MDSINMQTTPDPIPDPEPVQNPSMPPATPRSRAALNRFVLLPSIVAILGVTGVQARTLWREWQALQVAQYDDVHSRAVGYHDITPDFNFARPPDQWVKDEGDRSYLWASWDRRAGKHLWFSFPKGEIDVTHLTHPMGRDTLRAIDSPRTETQGGEIWKTIPPDNLVVVGEMAGLPLAYPLVMMDKVIAINDEVYNKPILIVYTPFVSDDSSVDMYDASRGGRDRYVMAHSGYLWDKKPLLFDRGGESLWVPTAAGLVALAGPSKGTVLSRLTHLSSAHWGEWSSAHPDGRLVVGANRPRKPPSK